MNPGQAFTSAALSAANALLNGGYMNYYTGTIPASPETAVPTGDTLLATDTFANPAFGTPSYTSPNEGAIANWASPTFAPVATGTAGWARAFTSAGVAENDYTVGVAGSGADVIVGNTGFETGTTLTNGTFKHNIPAF